MTANAPILSEVDRSVGGEKVAVIVRTRDRPQFLRRAIASIRAQTFSNWRIVIVNDGGVAPEVDAVAAEAELPRERYQIIHHQKPAGRAAACNAAVGASASEFIAVLDDDDTWYPEFLERCVQHLKAQPDDSPVRGVVTRTTEIDEIWSETQWCEQRRVPFNADLDDIGLEELAVENWFTNNAFVYRRDALPAVGLYDERLPVLEDWEFNVRFAAKYSIAVISEYLAFYHRRPRINFGAVANSSAREHRRLMKEIKKRWVEEDAVAERRGLGWLATHGRTRSTRRRLKMLKRALTVGRRGSE